MNNNLGDLEIAGMKIRNIKDAQEVLLALKTIKINLKNINESLNKNYEDYQSISKDVNNSINTQKEIIESISKIQIQANELVEKIKQTNKDIVEANIETIKITQNEIKKLSNRIIETINSIEFREIEETINTKLTSKINQIETKIIELNKIPTAIEKTKNKTIETLSSAYYNVDKNIKTNQKKLNSVTNKLNKSLDTFSKEYKSINKYKLFATAAICIAIGAIAATLILTLNYKLTNKTNTKLSKIDKIIKEYQIQLVNNDNNLYLTIPKSNLKDIYYTTNGYRVWELK